MKYSWCIYITAELFPFKSVIEKLDLLPETFHDAYEYKTICTKITPNAEMDNRSVIRNVVGFFPSDLYYPDTILEFSGLWGPI